ncbi:MAG: hypothetical protein CBC55_10845 [Gammaproteobacteria bacterium TMED95]|nr:MAG: hypothetical protein CBC55_10845 [Gammaproteobacteria bacterium TMED95]
MNLRCKLTTLAQGGRGPLKRPRPYSVAEREGLGKRAWLFSALARLPPAPPALAGKSASSKKWPTRGGALIARLIEFTLQIHFACARRAGAAKATAPL